MTGWRIGFAVGNPEIIGAMSKIASQTTSNPSAVAQYAAIEALTGDQSTVETMRLAFEERLNTILPLTGEREGDRGERPGPADAGGGPVGVRADRPGPAEQRGE